MAQVEIFRQTKHDALKDLGQTDGVADAAFLATVAANSNRLIAEGRHFPMIRAGHTPKGEESLGWVTSVLTDGTGLFADIDLTPTGKAKVESKELRHVSAGFRRDFNLTGASDSERLPGAWLEHVAFLGQSNPAIKQLTDLSRVQFSEADAGRIAHVTTNTNEHGEVEVYFTEMNSLDPEAQEDHVTEVEKLAAQVATFSEELKTLKHDKTTADSKVTELTAKFGEADAARVAAEAKLKELQDTAAKFAETNHEAAVNADVDALLAEKKIGGAEAKSLKALGKSLYGNAVGMAAFAENITAKKASKVIVPEQDLSGERTEADEAIKKLGLTKAMFSESPEKGRNENAIHVAAEKYLRDNKAEFAEYKTYPSQLNAATNVLKQKVCGSASMTE